MRKTTPGKPGMDFNPIMKIYTCEHCRYAFRYPMRPQACPDCGADAVRPASDYEVNDYWKMQKILQEEIRIGLYAAG